MLNGKVSHEADIDKKVSGPMTSTLTLPSTELSYYHGGQVDLVISPDQLGLLSLDFFDAGRV